MARHRHRHRPRRDRQRSDNLRDIVVGGLRVREPAYGRDLVDRGAHVLLRPRALVDCAFPCDKTDGRHRPDRERRSVVHAASAPRRQRQRLGSDRPRHLARAGEVALPRQRHRVATSVGLRVAGDGAVHRQTPVLHRGQRLDLLEAGVGERGAEHDRPVRLVALRDVRRRHLQVSLDLRYVVERGVRAALERVGEGVLARAPLGLRAGEGVGRAVRADEAVAADRHFVRRERRAVVDLHVALRGERHWAFGDRQLGGVYILLIVRIAHAIPDHVLADIGVNRHSPPRQGWRSGSATRAAAVVRRIHHNVPPDHRRAKRRHQRIRVDSMPFAIVHHGHIEFRFATLRHYAAAWLLAAGAAGRSLRHRQRAVHGGDLVVADFGVGIEGVGEGVFVLTHRYL